MIEILPISTPYSIKPTRKIIRDEKHDSHSDQAPLEPHDQGESAEDEAPTEESFPHIDEII